MAFGFILEMGSVVNAVKYFRVVRGRGKNRCTYKFPEVIEAMSWFYRFRRKS